MISYALLTCLIGLILWAIFAKTRLSDGWAARVGELMFFAGLLAWLLANQGKTLG